MNANLPSTNNTPHNSNSPLILKFFDADGNFVFIVKKTEKLISALYMISSFFADQEPLKWKLRTVGSELMTMSMSLNGSYGPKREKCVGDIQAKIFEIISLLSIAKNAGLVSDMNHSIIDKEFNVFAESLVQKNVDQNSQSASTINPQTLVVSGEGKSNDKEDVYVKDKNVQEPVELVDHLPKPSSRPVDKGQIINEEHLARGPQPKQERSLKEFGAVSVKKNSRQSVIIGLLKRKKEIMIKDVSPLISGCSEKTIQRELQAMVKEGILKKEGEKRWSRYSLARPQL